MSTRFEEFTTSIGRIYKCVQHIKNIEMDEFGLRGTHVMCLYFLGQSADGLTSGELSASCGEDKAAISRAVRELSEKNLIFLSKPEKRYRAKFSLTDQGKIVVNSMAKIIDEIVVKADNGLSDEERSVFYRVLDTFSFNLQKYMNERNV